MLSLFLFALYLFDEHKKEVWSLAMIDNSDLDPT